MTQFFTPCELARALRISESRLSTLRTEGRGPRFVKISRGKQGAVRYPAKAVLDWLRENSDGIEPADLLFDLDAETRVDAGSEVSHV